MNNIKIDIFILILLVLLSCTKKPLNPIEELKSIGLRIKNNNNIEYSYRSKIFRSYVGDTTYMQGKMYFEQNKSDSILGLNFYHNSKNSESFYNGEYIVILEKSDSAAYKKPLCDYKNGHMTIYPYIEFSLWAIQNFLTDSLLESKIKSIKRADTIINKKTYTYFKFLTDERFVSTHKKYREDPIIVEIIVEKDKHLPIYYSMFKKLKNSNSWYHYKTEFKNYSTDVHYPESMFSIENIPNYFKWDKHKSYIKTLPIGLLAPDWVLPEITVDSISLSSLKGKYVLLEFWVIGCGACIEAIPTLNKLMTKYGDNSFEVIGINCFSDKKEKIRSYCNNRGMHYRNVWKSKSICDKYKIKAAPIFYLINKEGKIVYSQIGHDSLKLVKIVDEFLTKTSP